MTPNPLPTLYSFRRCPYAMRARLALMAAGIAVELREVVLKDKPPCLLAASPKGTVPVLITAGGEVIDESRDIMLWALGQHDPLNWLQGDRAAMMALVDACDDGFKPWLDRYKYHDRHPEHPQAYYREQAEAYLVQWEQRLAVQRWLGECLGSTLFAAAMRRYKPWKAGDLPLLLR